VRLECDGAGNVALFFGARELARQALGEDAFRERIGVFVNPAADEAGAARRVVFELAEGRARTRRAARRRAGRSALSDRSPGARRVRPAARACARGVRVAFARAAR
jgi:hypothetical protein